MRDTYFHFEIVVLWQQVQTVTMKAKTKTLFFKRKTYVLECSIEDCDTLLSPDVGAAAWLSSTGITMRDLISASFFLK